ncbi:MAG TPA: hypothetical protein VGN72_14525 [Tepidisphaeraceae bacterium]|jgi:hypothetical protein|nr:hypothetical protein [Tepidisphaeraceae bacterium]
MPKFVQLPKPRNPSLELPRDAREATARQLLRQSVAAPFANVKVRGCRPRFYRRPMQDNDQ